jgi:hypothetical protein
MKTFTPQEGYSDEETRGSSRVLPRRGGSVYYHPVLTEPR